MLANINAIIAKNSIWKSRLERNETERMVLMKQFYAFLSFGSYEFYLHSFASWK